MYLIVLIVLIVLLLGSGGGGYYGYSRGWSWAAPAGGLLGFLLLVLIVWLLLTSFR